MKTTRLLIFSFIMTVLSTPSFAVAEIDTVYTEFVGEHVEFNWQTLSEVNSDYYTIERSMDSVNYAPLGNVVGAGNSSTIQNYSYSDSTVVIGQTYFYRLKSIDFDGSYDYSEIVKIATGTPTEIQEFNNISFQFYPNPISNQFTVQINDTRPQSFEFNLYNLMGQRVHSEIVKQKKLIDASQLPSGIYIFEVMQDGWIFKTGKLEKP